MKMIFDSYDLTIDTFSAWPGVLKPHAAVQNSQLYIKTRVDTVGKTNPQYFLTRGSKRGSCLFHAPSHCKLLYAHRRWLLRTANCFYHKCSEHRGTFSPSPYKSMKIKMNYTSFHWWQCHKPADHAWTGYDGVLGTLLEKMKKGYFTGLSNRITQILCDFFPHCRAQPVWTV